MPFALSCTDFTFHALPHEKALQLIADLEIPSCDLLFFPGCRHVQAQEVLEDPTGTAPTIARRVESAGLTVADVLGLFGSYRKLSPNDPDDGARAASRDSFARLVEFANGVGAHGVTIIPGMDWPGETHDMDRIDTITETVRLRDLFRRVQQGLPAEVDVERFPWD